MKKKTQQKFTKTKKKTKNIKAIVPECISTENSISLYLSVSLSVFSRAPHMHMQNELVGGGGAKPQKNCTHYALAISLTRTHNPSISISLSTSISASISLFVTHCLSLSLSVQKEKLMKK